jgi:hypothetical protein
MKKLLMFREFYSNLDKLIEKGIVVKKGIYYYLGRDKFYIRDNKVYINTDMTPCNLTIYSKSYLDLLGDKEFKYERSLCFSNPIDRELHLKRTSYPYSLYRIEKER